MATDSLATPLPGSEPDQISPGIPQITRSATHSTDFEMPVSSANALTLIPGGVNSRFTICSLMLSE